jgi:hypothetical protein
LLVARGGVEAHGHEVLTAAARAGLRVVERAAAELGVLGLLGALEGAEAADILSLRSPLNADSRRLLLHGSHAVLANSGHEPFGLVGLETMAVGGVACTGASGEDYAIPGHNALVLETNDPEEFLGLFGTLRTNPAPEQALRRVGRATAKLYRWSQVIQRVLLPRLHLLAGPVPGSIPHSAVATPTAALIDQPRPSSRRRRRHRSPSLVSMPGHVTPHSPTRGAHGDAG